MMHRLADAWEEVGFVVTEREEVSEGAKIVGYELQNFPPRLKLASAKASYLRGGLQVDHGRAVGGHRAAAGPRGRVALGRLAEARAHVDPCRGL